MTPLEIEPPAARPGTDNGAYFNSVETVEFNAT